MKSKESNVTDNDKVIIKRSPHSKMQNLVFVIVRHVNSAATDEYWKQAYCCVRKYYDNKILIVDDNSNPSFLKEDSELINCETVKSEFPGGGEILGYYYFHKLHLGDKMVMIHDSVFLNTYIDFAAYGDAKALWSFQHNWDEDIPILKLMLHFDNHEELTALYCDKGKWVGCFGVMSVITWDLLDKINRRHNFFPAVLAHVNNRTYRSYMERVFACVCQVNYPSFSDPPHIVNNIHTQGVGLSYNDYKQGLGDKFPIIKVWTGR